LSGGGEPTLHAHLGDIVLGAKSLTDVPLSVITNGSLLWDADVRDALRVADVVLPSLDAGNARIFEYVDRPVSGISFEQMVGGLVRFRESFQNAIWLEVMLVDGITSGESEVSEIAQWVARIRPDRVQLNTVVRPPAESFALPIPRARLEFLAKLFSPCAEVIADYGGPSQETENTPDVRRVLELIQRRPCSLQEIAATLGLRHVETAKLLERLIGQDKIAERCFGNDKFFAAIHEGNEDVI
jgi:wyosine [tRNA(Phe)-imidazoG37] synthetase (radical SAM superfamily)